MMRYLLRQFFFGWRRNFNYPFVTILRLVTFGLLPCAVTAQTVVGESAPIQIKVGKDRPGGKPALAYTNVLLRDENKNKTLEGYEKASITFTISNAGKGYSQNLFITARTENENEIKGIVYPTPVKIDSIAPGKKREVVFPISGSPQLASGIATLAIEIREEFEYDPDQIELNILTSPFQAPKLQLSNYTLETEVPKLNAVVTATLKIVVENKGEGSALDTRLLFQLPAYAQLVDSCNYELNSLQPGESRRIQFRFRMHASHLQEEIPIQALVVERHQHYGQEITMRLRATTRGSKN